MKHSNTQIRKAVKSASIVISGNILYAAGMVFFILPSGLITGGTTGIALIANHLAGISVSAFVGAFNILMFIVGTLILGKKFALRTIISTLAYPYILDIMENLAGGTILTGNILICAVMGGLCVGTSLAVIIGCGASTGGMDIPPLIINRKFHVPVSVSLYAFDFVILAGQMIFSDIRGTLCGILMLAVYSITMDRLLAMHRAMLFRSHTGQACA